MKLFKVNSPSTFYTRSPEIVIYDSNQFPFYFHTNTARHINFNLPPGNYYSNVPLTKKPFKPYGQKKYPRFPKGFLKRINIYKLKNKNKASISLKRSKIYVDPMYHDNPYEPLQTFTLLHELFHHFFHAKTIAEKKNPYIHEFIESQCDDAARNYMLANGFNPSQVRIACGLLLRSKFRNKCIHNTTTHVNNNFRR
jgi:hypothetical protein